MRFAGCGNHSVQLGRLFGLALVLAVCIGCATTQHLAERTAFGEAKRYDVVLVSLTYLLANPERLNGQRIRTSGIFLFEFESDSLFLDRESLKNRVSLNAVAIDMDIHQLGLSRKNESRLSGRTTVMEGIWNGSNPKQECEAPRIEGNEKIECVHIGGHYSGALSDINYIQIRPRQM